MTTLRLKSQTIGLALCAALLFFGFVALGSWQLYRLEWKEALIHRVESRVHAPVQPAPKQQEWPQINKEDYEYLHIVARGQFLHDHMVRVQAITVLGSGFWLMVPLQLQDSSIVWVNRGFIPSGQNTIREPVSGLVYVEGLLRMSEPNGGFLRSNQPKKNRWYSRDISAMTFAQGLTGTVAPWFLDEGGSRVVGQGYPVAGLTVIHFSNNHLVYALTWYTLALMVLGAAWLFYKKRI